MAAFPDFNCPLYGSYSRSGPSRHLLRTQMEVGRPKVRRRSSQALYSIKAAYAFTRIQVNFFESWYRNTIGAGLDTFEWTDRRTATVRLVKFADDAYSISQLTPKRWLLSINLEEWA